MTPSPARSSVIPTTAWIIAGLVGATLMFIGFTLTMSGHIDPPIFLACIAGSVLVAGYTVLIGYVYGDAKRRGMRYVLWTWLAILVPNSIGIILYFILREPLMVYCSRCGCRSKPGLPYCPSCGGAMAPTCPQCQHVVQSGWSHCAYCGTPLTRTSPNAPTTGGIPGTV